MVFSKKIWKDICSRSLIDSFIFLKLFDI